MNLPKLSTTDHIAGRVAVEHIALVRVNKTLVPSAGARFKSSFKAMTGGENPVWSAGASNIQDELFHAIAKQAAELGADAVVGIRIVTAVALDDNVLIYTAYGTAIRTEARVPNANLVGNT